MDHNEGWDYTLAVLGIIFGIILCFAGYAVFTPLLISVGFFLGFYVVYTILLTQTTLALWIVILISLAAGVGVGVLTKIFWKVGVFLAGAIGGFLLGNFIQNTTSDGLIGPLWALWLVIAALMLIGGVLAVFFVKPAIIVATAFCGAFGIMAGTDTFIGDQVLFGLDFIHLDDPHRDSDVKTWVVWMFYGLWALLMFVGIIVQTFGPLGDSNHEKRYPKDENIVLLTGEKKTDPINV
uniref:Transmembrane protein 198 n=1 Tax=Paramoeba aestuarina TaxID=180227 RepID=A0A7S4N5H0_9EUKA|mmetsp:Transcript_11219/g.16975  ORF Transcript_11219/g.16975 Transcript_11219/m.16975 type:complete len:237 (+) Transcript_11219:110-820(+)